MDLCKRYCLPAREYTTEYESADYQHVYNIRLHVCCRSNSNLNCYIHFKNTTLEIESQIFIYLTARMELTRMANKGVYFDGTGFSVKYPSCNSDR